MGKSRNKHPFDDDSFVGDWIDWMGSPEGQLSIEASCVLWDLMESVQLDARQRELIWPESERLSLEQSADRIQRDHPDFPRPRIESFLVSWLENCAPEEYSEEQLRELDDLVEPWLRDLECQARLDAKQPRTPDS